MHRRTIGLALIAFIFVAACGSSPSNAAPTAVAVASIEPTAEPTPTIEPTDAPEATNPPDGTGGPCPTAPVLTVREFVEAPSSCFGGNDIRIRGWLDTPAAFGFLPPLVKPSWLYYPPGDRFVALFDVVPTDPDHVCAEADCASLLPHTTPDSGISFEPLERWVIVTGHINDPAAERCRYIESEIAPGPFDDASARESCRANFVVVALEDDPGS
jgi:hypothetical protein